MSLYRQTSVNFFTAMFMPLMYPRNTIPNPPSPNFLSNENPSVASLSSSSVNSLTVVKSTQDCYYVLTFIHICVP